MTQVNCTKCNSNKAPSGDEVQVDGEKRPKAVESLAFSTSHVFCVPEPLFVMLLVLLTLVPVSALTVFSIQLVVRWLEHSW